MKTRYLAAVIPLAGALCLAPAAQALNLSFSTLADTAQEHGAHQDAAHLRWGPRDHGQPHRLQVAKLSSATTTDTPIDATPTDAATTGNSFRLTDDTTGEWHFNLNTKGLSKGIWQITATLSDGTAHRAFIGLK